MPETDQDKILKAGKLSIDISVLGVPKYFNASVVATTADEFLFFLGLRRPSNPNILDVSSYLAVSPVQAKVLSENLKRQVEEYEKDFGPIVLEVSERLTEHGKKTRFSSNSAVKDLSE